MFIAALFANTTVNAQLSPGDIVILDINLDSDPSTFGKGVLFRVDAATGQRTVLSDFGDASQGPLLIGSTQGMAIEGSGNILIFAQLSSSIPPAFGYSIHRVDPNTGQRTVVSDFNDASQGPIGAPQDGSSAIVVESSGAIVTAGYMRHVHGDFDALYRVDPDTGQRTVLSDFGEPSQGPGGKFLGNMTVEATGAILLACQYSGTSGRGVLLRVDPNTGERTVVSDFGNASQGPLGSCPSDVAVETSDMALVTDPCSDTPDGALFRVHLGTGSRTLLSNFRDSAQGPLGSDPWGVTTEASGAILVADPSAGLSSVEECRTTPPLICRMRPVGAIFRVDPVTGIRTVVSDFGDPSTGPLGRTPFRIEVAKVSVNNPAPTNKDQCKDGSWQTFNTPRTFQNQGDCIQFFNTGK